jgi:transcriptional regulator with XRE-family HTH domain
MQKIKDATKGMTAEEVARRTGIKVRTVRSHTQGQRRPGVDALRRYAQGLGLDLRELIEDQAQVQQ